MANYLCGRCRSNDCLHVSPRLAQQLAERYLNGEVSRAPFHASEMNHMGYIYGTSEQITFELSPRTPDKKLLLLRRKK